MRDRYFIDPLMPTPFPPSHPTPYSLFLSVVDRRLSLETNLPPSNFIFQLSTLLYRLLLTNLLSFSRKRSPTLVSERTTEKHRLAIGSGYRRRRRRREKIVKEGEFQRFENE